MSNSVNLENIHGWHTGDGAHLLYDADLAQFDDNFWATVDSSRLPGVTAIRRDRADAEGQEYLSVTQWAGGVATGLLGTAGMDLTTADGLRARKSWFMTGDAITFLGAGISTPTGGAVETTIENHKVAADVVVEIDGTHSIGGTGAAHAPHTRWLHADSARGQYGWVFHDPAAIDASVATRTGSWAEVNKNPTFTDTERHTDRYLTITTAHGDNPNSARYAWTMLPGASSKDTQKLARKPAITVLANSASAQAIAHDRNVLANIWDDASLDLGDLSVTGAACVIVEQSKRLLTIAISDPTQQRTAPCTSSCVDESHVNSAPTPASSSTPQRRRSA